jgi:hypothetical protein
MGCPLINSFVSYTDFFNFCSISCCCFSIKAFCLAIASACWSKVALLKLFTFVKDSVASSIILSSPKSERRSISLDALLSLIPLLI